jgi:hypothetical protein
VLAIAIILLTATILPIMLVLTMPRKEQGWITFQSSREELQLLEQYCKRSQRTKTDVLRSLLRTLQPKLLKKRSKQFDSTEVDLDMFNYFE